MKHLVLVLAVVCTSALAQRRGPARIAVPLPPLPPISYDQPGNPSPTPSQYSASPAQQYSASPAQQYSASPAQEYSPLPTQSQFSGSPKYSPRPQEYDSEPQSRQKDYVTPIPIIRFDKEQSIDGSYKSSYETGNNIIAEETGFLKNVGIKDQEALVQHGSYTYTSPDGTVITVTYTADEGGFRAEGSHLPTPPPVPEEIQKSLDLIYEQIRLQAEKEAKDPNYQKNLQENETTNNSADDNYPRRFRK